MSRRASVVGGWVLIVAAILSGLLTIPVWNVQGSSSGSSGSVVIESSPFHTSVVGNGQFTHEAFWTVSWTAVVVCGLLLAGGAWVVRRKRVPTATRVFQVPPQALQPTAGA